MSITELYPIGSVVWNRVPNYPWWPSKVKAINEDEGSIELVPFQEDYPCPEDKISNLKPFAGDETRELVARGKKTLKRKPKTLQQFTDAIQDAVEYLQSKDPGFTLGFDPFLDASVLLSDISQTSTPGASTDMPVLDSSIFTTGSCSGSGGSKQNGSGRRTAASISAQSTPILGEDRPKQEEALRSDILPKVPGADGRHDRKKRKRSAQEENRREEGEEDDRHSKPKRKRSLKGKERMDAKKEAGGKRSRKEKQTSGPKVGVDAGSGDELMGGEAAVARRLSYETVPEDVCLLPEMKSKKKKVKKSGQSSSCPSQSNATPPSSVTLSPRVRYPTAASSERSDPEESDRLRTSPPRQDKPSDPNPKCDVSALPLQVDAVSSSQDSSLSGFSQEGNSAQAKSRGGLSAESIADVASTSDVGFESSLVFSGVSTPTRVGGRGHGGGDSDDKMREGSSEGSSESEDDLPAIDMAVKESISVSELAPNDVIWAKYERFPHWPALVVSVTPRSKKKKRRSVLSNPRKPKPKIIFFGYDDTELPISTTKNIAPFGTKDTEVFLERGRAQEAPLKKAFMMAVDEARKLLRSRADKEISGSPKEQLKQIIEARPKSHKTTQSPMVMRKKQLCTEESPPTVSAFGYRLDNVQAMLLKGASFDESSDSESEEEEESLLYTFEAVTKSFQELKPILVDIIHEKHESEFHKIFVSGSRKEQRTLKVAGKFGPINRWPETKKLMLLKPLEKLAREETNNLRQFTYALDVLLPEAMIRTMMKFENISCWDEALEKL